MPKATSVANEPTTDEKSQPVVGGTRGSIFSLLLNIGAPAACLLLVLFGPSDVVPSGGDASPDEIADLLNEPLRITVQNIGDGIVNGLRAEAEAAAAKGRHREAAELYRDLLEARPRDEPALAALQAALLKAHPRASADGAKADGGTADTPELLSNHSEHFRSAMERLVSSGAAELVSRDPPAYVLHNVLTRDEAKAVLAVRQRHRDLWTTNEPLICFSDRRFAADARLEPHMRHGLAGGRRSCLSAALSAAASRRGAVRYSESVSIYRGQESLLDRMGERLERVAGLQELSGQAFQLLSYADGSSYAAHVRPAGIERTPPC